ncbi:MAG: hypothetical protein M3252_08935 [Actinomycetota bacterium]|nr:hypothetical protein [Actinomycetota bacterium]
MSESTGPGTPVDPADEKSLGEEPGVVFREETIIEEFRAQETGEPSEQPAHVYSEEERTPIGATEQEKLDRRKAAEAEEPDRGETTLSGGAPGAAVGPRQRLGPSQGR